MARPVEVGDIVNVTAGDIIGGPFGIKSPDYFNEAYIIRKIENDKIYISTTDTPDELSVLFSENGKWKVEGTDKKFNIYFYAKGGSEDKLETDVEVKINELDKEARKITKEVVELDRHILDLKYKITKFQNEKLNTEKIQDDLISKYKEIMFQMKSVNK